MHSVTLDGSPKKRTLSRGISEDESLRSLIKESESSSRRLTRSDSRAGTLKKRPDSQPSDQDLFMGLPEMLELQASYDEVVQELRGLEVEREALLFQVDVLQDTLEGVEELLAEAQREARQANAELAQERQAKRKLESVVCSLMKEVERLKEEKNNLPSAPANTNGHVDQPAEANHRDERDSLLGPFTLVNQTKEEEEEGSFVMKLKKMAITPQSHVPSLSVDNPLAEDGVLRRPYENGIEEGRDSSPERNDSDISAYEDASAETPEHHRMLSDDTLELPDDSTNNEGNSKPTDPKEPEGCVVS